MKCPFRIKTITTKNIKKAYQYPYDEEEKFFHDCYKGNCMAYDKENNKCVKLNVEDR